MRPYPLWMTSFRIVEIAAVLDVSDDTIRRWIDRGEFDAAPNDRGRLCVEARRRRGWPRSGPVP